MSAVRLDGRPSAPPPLERDAHKGDAGTLAVLAGSDGMPGAALLVIRAAQRAGAGLVALACFDENPFRAAPLAAPEAVLLDLRRQGVDGLEVALADREADALLAGPGMGVGDRTRRAVEKLLEREEPLVLDADALNVFAGAPERLRREAPLVLTPHPGEATRLLGRTIPRDEHGRVEAAVELAERTGAVCVLKGAGTVVTDGARVAINPTGSPALATAGSGDVLAGVVGAYLGASARTAGSWSVLDAARAAVWVHGWAGELAAKSLGERGVIARDLIEHVALAQRTLAAEGGSG